MTAETKIKLSDGREVDSLEQAEYLGVLPVNCACTYEYGHRRENTLCQLHGKSQDKWRELATKL